MCDDFAKIEIEKLPFDDIHRRPDTKATFLCFEYFERNSTATAYNTIGAVRPTATIVVALGYFEVVRRRSQLVEHIVVRQNNKATWTSRVWDYCLLRGKKLAAISVKNTSARRRIAQTSAVTAVIGVRVGSFDSLAEDVAIDKLEFAIEPPIVDVVRERQRRVVMLLEPVGEQLFDLLGWMNKSCTVRIGIIFFGWCKWLAPIKLDMLLLHLPLLVRSTIPEPDLVVIYSESC